jgi:hypothetical protein
MREAGTGNTTGLFSNLDPSGRYVGCFLQQKDPSNAPRGRDGTIKAVVLANKR